MGSDEETAREPLKRVGIALHPAVDIASSSYAADNISPGSATVLEDESMLDFTVKTPRAAGFRSPYARRSLWRLRIRVMLSVLFDIALLNIGYFLAFYVRFTILNGKPLLSTKVPFTGASLVNLRPFQFGFVAIMLLLMALRGMYGLRLTGTVWRQLGILLGSAFTGFALYSALEFVVKPIHLGLDDNTRAFVAFSWLAAIIVPFVGRLIVGLAIGLGYRLGIGRQRVLVVGSGRSGKLVMQHLAAIPSLGYQIIGFISDRGHVPVDFGRFKALGVLDDLELLLREQSIVEAIIALPASRQGQITRCMRICERNGVTFKLVPDLQEFSLTRLELNDVGGLPLFDLRHRAGGQWQRSIKRTADIVIAVIALALASPLWLLVSALVKLDSPGPAIYRQTRIGLLGQPFTTLKFRSMYVDADARRHELEHANHSGRGLFKLKDDPRRTRVGRFIRRTSIDEIPQLFNVLRGEMSLIGPRPPLPQEYARYEEWEKRRLEMQPGLTGLWQVRGRSNIVFEEMVLMDLYYIENWSLGLDMQILLKTIPTIVFSHGAY